MAQLQMPTNTAVCTNTIKMQKI